jgi:hypothetical protein
MATIPPRAICCDITEQTTQVTATRRYAIHEGDTYEDEFQVTDTAGDPVDLTGFTALMEFRAGLKSEGWPVLGTASVVISQPLIGSGEYEISSTTTALFSGVDRVYAELQVSNDTNPLYSPTYVATVFTFDYVVTHQVTA